MPSVVMLSVIAPKRLLDLTKLRVCGKVSLSFKTFYNIVPCSSISRENNLTFACFKLFDFQEIFKSRQFYV